MTTSPPPPAVKDAPKPVDFDGGDGDSGAAQADPNNGDPKPAWHGTILPAGDGDVWLASGFARFQDYVADEKDDLKTHELEREKDADTDKPATQPGDGGLTQDERDKLAVELFRFRAAAMSEGMDQLSVPLANIKSDVSDDNWFRSAAGRGVMLLSELRRRIGAEQFDEAMDKFGRANAGKPVDSQSFIAAMNKLGGPSLNNFFDRWLNGTDALPTLELAGVSCTKKDSGYLVSGRVVSHGGCTPANIDVTIETGGDETTHTIPFLSDAAEFNIDSDDKPTRVVINKYGQTPCTNGWIWGGESYLLDLDHTLIIYGTRVDSIGNQIAAQKLQRAIIQQWEHRIVPIKADTDVTDADLHGQHLLLIGRPECSELFQRLTLTLPAKFGPDSFTADGKLYANSESAVIATAANPLDPHFSLICIAGLNPEATLRRQSVAPRLPRPAEDHARPR